MIKAPAPHQGRKPRADGARNRDLLLAAAKSAFADAGTDVSLDEISRRAGLGTGTFYRHFANRDAIVAAVYEQEVGQLADAAQRLLATQAAGTALHEWMRLFVDYIATKKPIAPALGALAHARADLFAASSENISGAMRQLVASAIADGEIRADADPADLLRALLGLT